MAQGIDQHYSRLGARHTPGKSSFLESYHRQCEAYAYMNGADRATRMNMTNEKALKDYMTKFILERAHTFRVGHEDEDAWSAALHAKTSFKIMNRVADSYLAAEHAALDQHYRGGNPTARNITATEVMNRMAMAKEKMQPLDPTHIKAWHDNIEKMMHDVMVYGGGIYPLGAEIKGPRGGGMSNAALDKKITTQIRTKTPTSFRIRGDAHIGDARSWLQETRSLTPRQQRRLTRKQKGQSKA